MKRQSAYARASADKSANVKRERAKGSLKFGTHAFLSVGNRQSAMGSGQWAVGSGQWAVGLNFWRRKVVNKSANSRGHSPLTIHDP
jgi:hypothetical protein